MVRQEIKMEIGGDDTKDNLDASNLQEVSYEEKLKNVNSIATPMASKKLTKKIYKLIKKGMI